MYIRNPNALHRELERFFGCKINKDKMVKLANKYKGKFRIALIDIAKFDKEKRKANFNSIIGDIFT